MHTILSLMMIIITSWTTDQSCLIAVKVSFFLFSKVFTPYLGPT